MNSRFRFCSLSEGNRSRLWARVGADRVVRQSYLKGSDTTLRCHSTPARSISSPLQGESVSRLDGTRSGSALTCHRQVIHYRPVRFPPQMQGESVSRFDGARSGSALTCHRQVIHYRPVRFPPRMRGKSVSRLDGARSGRGLTPHCGVIQHSPVRFPPSIYQKAKATPLGWPFPFGGAGVIKDEHSSVSVFLPSKASSISSSGMFSMLNGFLLALIIKVK